MTLVGELSKEQYSNLSDQEAADALNALTETETYSRFASFRTLAALLTEEEYGAVRAAVDAAKAQSVLVADMLSFLELPGDEAGNGGGIDVGSAGVRAALDAMLPEMIATKIKAYAEREVRPWADVTWDEVQRARGG